MGDFIWIFSGIIVHDYNSIEFLDLTDKKNKWQVIPKLEAFSPRVHPIVCPISPDKILVCGGINQINEKIKDIIVVDTKLQTAKKVGDAPIGLSCLKNGLAINN